MFTATMRRLCVVVGVAALLAVEASATKFLPLDDIRKLIIKYGQKTLTTFEHNILNEFFGSVQTPVIKMAMGSYIQNAALCEICKVAMVALTVLIQSGSTEQHLIDVGTEFCVDFGLYSYEVCHGMLTLNVPIVAYIILNTPEGSAETLCSLLVQSNEDPKTCPTSDPRFEWTIDLPDQPAQLPVLKKRKREKPYRFAIVTDFHLDPLYEPFSDTDCGDPICCHAAPKLSSRQSKTTIDLSILASSIITVGNKTGLDIDKATRIQRAKVIPAHREDAQAGYWGNYKSCDTPMWAFDDAINRITNTHKNIDAVYYIGDSISHRVWKTTYDGNRALHQYVSRKLREGFGDNVLVVPAIGNHEPEPLNQFAPPSVSEDLLNTTWLYRDLVDLYGNYLTEQAKHSLAERGSFSVLFKKRLRIISINNNIAQRYNWWLMYDPLQPKELLKWLVHELYKAESAGEKVHILAHIPPGISDLIYTWTREYNRVINRFSATIMAEFNGHTHTDEFRIFYNVSDSSQPVAVAWGAGGVTTFTNYNPNYKLITLDPHSYELKSMKTYIYNLSEANLTPQKRPQWFKLYDLNNSYNLKNLSPTSMDDLVFRMVTSEHELLDLYSAHFSKLSHVDPCDANCKVDRLCQIVVSVLWDRRKCEEFKRLYLNFKMSSY